MSVNEVLKSGDVVLPPPVSLSIDDEIIWSEDTGRTLAGDMVGDVVTEKKKVSIKWGFLQESEIVLIKSRLIAGFFPVTFHDDGLDITINTYRGTLSKEQLGRLDDGVYWYRSASVELIQQ